MNQPQAKHSHFMTIPEVHGIFVDAILTDNADNLVFGSFWGKDTSIREFQARLTLKDSSGLRAFRVQSMDTQTYVRISNIESIEHLSGRVQTDILGVLVHYWLYQHEVIKPDVANLRATLIRMSNELDISEGHAYLWPAIQALCPVPLLDQWSDVIVPQLINAGMVKPINGIGQSGTVITINEDEVIAIVKAGCLDGSITIN